MRVGRHETVREIRRSGAASVWEIESDGPAGGDARGALKLLQPPPFWSESERAERIDQFLRRAAVQAQVTGRHWAPVHDRGEDDQGAFYVTDLYPQSAEQLIRRTKTELDGEGLYRLIDGVVAGLDELRASAGRPHGRLAPGNVLLTAQDPRAASVALSDPALHPNGGEAVDCHAVGELIYALVLRQTPKPGAVAAESPAWSGLGSRGEAWRELCNRLLGAGRPIDSLEALRAEVAECKPPVVSAKRVRSVGKWVGTLAAIVLGGGALFFHQYKTHQFSLADWQELCDESKWLGPFVEGLKGEGRFDLVARERPGIEVLRGMEHVTAGQISGETSKTPEALSANPSPAVQTWRAVGETQKALKAARVVKKAVEDDWPLRNDMIRVGEKFAELRLTLPAQLGQKAKETHLHDSGLAGNMAKLVRYRDWVTTLDALGEHLKVIRTSKDWKLTDLLVRLLYDRIFDGVPSDKLTEVRKIERGAGQVADVVTGMARGQFDEGDFLAHRALNEKGGLEQLEAWVAQAEGYRKLVGNENPKEAEPRVNWRYSGNKDEDEALGVAPGQEARWDQLLDGIDAEIANLKKDSQVDPEVPKEVEREVVRLAGIRDALDKLVPVKKDAVAVREKVQAFVKDAKGVRRRVGLALVRDPKEEIEKFAVSMNDQIGQVKPVPGLEEVVKAHKEQLKWVRDADPKVMRLWRKKIERQAIESFFDKLSLDTTVGGGADGRKWFDGVDGVKGRVEAEAKRRTLAVVESVQWEPRPTPKALEERANKALADFGRWKSSVEALVGACVALENRLNEYPSPVAVGDSDSKVAVLLARLDKVTPEIAESMKTVLGRAREWEKMASKSGDELRAMLEKRDRAQFAYLDGQLVAWRKADGWTSLGKSDEARRDLLARIADEKPVASAELAKLVRDTWLTNIVIPLVGGPPSARAHEVMGEATTLLDQANPPLAIDDFKGHPECYHNLAVYRLVAAVEAAKKDPKVEELLGDVLRETPSGAAMESALALLRERNEAASKDKGIPVNQAGPGARPGWTYEEVGPLLHSYTKKKGKKVVKLVFVEVEGTKCFLCQTELSVEAAIEAGLKMTADPEGGPQTWALTGPGQIVSVQDWFPPDPRGIQYKPAPGDQIPQFSYQYPLQRITVGEAEGLANALNCRLPTVQEWRAAYGAETAGNPSAVVWNLRDAKSWAEYDQMIEADRAKALAIVAKKRDFFNLDPMNWTLAGGAVPPNGGNPPTDDHVFFQEVDNFQEAKQAKPWMNVGHGKLFYHLVGNVAEFVVGESQENTARFAIGGSALSSLPFDKPVKVDTYKRYSDVGVRLAFNRPIEPLYVRLNLPSKGQGLYLVNPVGAP